MTQKSSRKNELQNKLIDILYESKAISLEMNREDFNPKISLINDLKLDSIQLLEYLMAIELKLDVNVDYEDLQIDVFDDFNEFTNYFYQKVTEYPAGENDE
jgi:acyl carrier protein